MIDHEAEVKKVYPNAIELDNDSETHYANLCWISDGNGNDISEDCKWSDDAWRSAYNNLVSQGLITP